MSHRRAATAAAAFLLLVPAARAASAEKTEEATWDAEPGTVVAVSAVNGDVRVRQSEDGKLHVRATKKAKGKSDDDVAAVLDRVKIQVEKGKGRLTVTADVPSSAKGGGFLSAIFGHDVDVTVDFDIGLPKRCPLEAKSVNGTIDCLGIASDIDANDVNGAIVVAESGGAVSAETVNGAINVEIVAPLRSGKMTFSTVNGAIELELPEGTGATIHGETLNGKLASDYALAIKKRLVGSEMDGDIGGGGAAIHIESINGTIHVGKAGARRDGDAAGARP